MSLFTQLMKLGIKSLDACHTAKEIAACKKKHMLALQRLNKIAYKHKDGQIIDALEDIASKQELTDSIYILIEMICDHLDYTEACEEELK